ncbi:hypothetical protein GCM10027186_06260 [Micromonospora schwarzwaldensis]
MTHGVSLIDEHRHDPHAGRSAAPVAGHVAGRAGAPVSGCDGVRRVGAPGTVHPLDRAAYPRR